MAAKVTPGCSILDVGGGRGEFLTWLTETDRKHHTDGSAYAVSVARAAGLDSQVADCYALPFPDDSEFDVVVCAELIEHLEKPSACIAELRRVCKPGGWVTVTTPNQLLIEDKQHIWSFTARDVRELLGEGSEVIEVGNHLTGYWRKPLK